MRSHTLHTALRAFTEEAGGLLADETARGAEIPFELVEEGGRARTPLYCYRPLTGEFVRGHASALEGLPSHPAAVRALSEHADRLPRYLSALGERPAGGTTGAMNGFLAAVYAEQTHFPLEGARFDRAYAQLEDALFAGRTDATVVVPVLGLDIASEEVVLGEGLSLRRADATPGLPADVEDVVAVFRATVSEGEPDPFIQAGRRFRRLLTALRLYDDGLIALGPVAWTRVDDGPWRSAVLGAGGPAGARGLTRLEN